VTFVIADARVHREVDWVADLTGRSHELAEHDQVQVARESVDDGRPA
jgi:pyrimidine operon attenuation protein/uracil phosphoribosyltransferase